MSTTTTILRINNNENRSSFILLFYIFFALSSPTTYHRFTRGAVGAGIIIFKDIDWLLGLFLLSLFISLSNGWVQREMDILDNFEAL